MDALLAARDVRQYVDGRDLEGYRADGLLRAAVERKLMIVGEALNRLSKLDPSIAEEIPDLARVVAFRNHLVHGYATMDDTLVWGIVESLLPCLLAVLEGLAPECRVAVPSRGSALPQVLTSAVRTGRSGVPWSE